MSFFIKIILIISGIYLFFKLIFKGLLNLFFDSETKNFNAKKREQDEMVRQSKKQQGRVTIKYQPKSDKNFKKDEGDYVDFEEV